MICKYCTAKIPDYAMKCKHCGEWLKREEEKKPKKYSAFQIVVIVILCIIIYGCIALMFFAYNNKLP